MASLVVLWDIYFEDRDSSQSMKNPVVVQSPQARRKEKLCKMKLALWQFRNPCEISLPCKSFLSLLNVPIAFDFLTFCHFLDFFPICPPVLMFVLVILVNCNEVWL